MILSFGVFQLAYFSALMALGSDIARKDLGGASAWAAIITGELVGRIIGGVIAFKVHFTVHLFFTNLFCIPTAIQLFSFDWLGSLALNPLGYALVGLLSAIIGERRTMGYSVALLSFAIFLPSTLPAVRGVRLSRSKAALESEQDKNDSYDERS